MITELGAQEQYKCKLETSPPPGNLESSEISYGLFASADKARKQFDEGLRFEDEEGAESCSQSVLRRMREILSEGDSWCFVQGEREYLAIWWNENGSRVLGVVDFVPSTKPETAVQAWERILSKG